MQRANLQCKDVILRNTPRPFHDLKIAIIGSDFHKKIWYLGIEFVQSGEDIQVVFNGVSHFFVSIPLLYPQRQTKALLPVMLHL